MSTPNLLVTASQMRESREQLTTTTFEREFYKEFGKRIGTRVWIAVFGTFGYERINGAKTHKEEQQAIDRLKSKLGNFVSHMPRPVTDTRITDLLGKPASTKGERDTNKLLKHILPEFHAALQGRARQIVALNPASDFSPIEQQAALQQAGLAEVRAKIDEHNNAWYKPGKITHWKEGLNKILAMQSVNAIGDHITAEDIRTKGAKTVADPFNVHLLTFGLDDASESETLKARTRNEIVKKSKKDCDERFQQLNPENYSIQEAQKRAAARKAPIEQEIADLLSKMNKIQAALNHETNIQAEANKEKPLLEKELATTLAELEPLNNPRPSPAKYTIESLLRKTFTAEQLIDMYRALTEEDERNISEADWPKTLINWCQKSREKMLARVEEQIKSQQSKYSTQPVVSSLRQLNTLLKAEHLYTEVDQEATRACRAQEKAEKEKSIKPLKHMKFLLENALARIKTRDEQIASLETAMAKYVLQLKNKSKELLEINHILTTCREIDTNAARLARCEEDLASALQKRGQLEDRRQASEETLESHTKTLAFWEKLLTSQRKRMDTITGEAPDLSSIKKCGEAITRIIVIITTYKKDIDKLKGDINSLKDQWTSTLENIANLEGRINTLKETHTEKTINLEKVAKETFEEIEQQSQNLFAIANATVTDDDSLDGDFTPFGEGNPNQLLEGVDLLLPDSEDGFGNTVNLFSESEDDDSESEDDDHFYIENDMVDVSQEQVSSEVDASAINTPFKKPNIWNEEP